MCFETTAIRSTKLTINISDNRADQFIYTNIIDLGDHDIKPS
jgi:hypothetical protein